MTIQNFLKEHQTKVKATQKLIVRDLDEISKNEIVAYVDEGKESYDVQVVFDNKNNIKITQCDCGLGGICNHIVALIHFIFENKTVKKVIKKPIKKKLTETDSLLETIDNEELRLWFSEILNKNKELAFAFKNKFGNKEIIVDEQQIKQTVQESIASVIGKRKTCETNEVKKIVDALTVSLKPILAVIFSKVNTENDTLLQILINELQTFHYNYYLTSTRVTKFIENLYHEKLKTIFALKNFEEWQKATTYYINLIFSDKIYLNDLTFAENIYKATKENELQRKVVVSHIESQYNLLYKNHKEKFYLLNFEMEHFLIVVFSENHLFEKYHTNFKPKRFQINYNLFLIGELLSCNKLDVAEKYCLEQISNNSNKDYDLPYAKILIEIYKTNKETQKLANILSDFGKYIFKIEDYNFIKEHATEEKFKKYRQAVLTNASYAYQSRDINAFDFYFEIKKLDNKTNDLFDMLKNSHNIEFVNIYKETAHKLDEIKFLKTVLEMSFYYSSKEEIIDEIVNYIIGNVDKVNLKFYLKNIKSYFSNSIYLALEDYLNS